MIIRENKYFNIEGNEDENYRIYHTRMQLLERGWSRVAAFKGVYSIDYGTPIPPIMDLFLNAPGVVWVRMMNYQIEVRKSPLFTWEEIDQTLLGALLGTVTALEEPADMADVVEEIRKEIYGGEQSDSLPVRLDDGPDARRDSRLLRGNGGQASGLDDSNCTAA